MTINESGITLNLPENSFFRLDKCEGFKKMQNISNMDVCWYEHSTDTLYLVELKGWTDDSIDEEKKPGFSISDIEKKKKGISSYRVTNILDKSIDTVCVFMSLLLGKQFSMKNIQPDCPFTITNTTKIKLLTIVNWEIQDTTYIANIYDDYKAKFKPYANLFDIKAFVVMTKEQAANRYDWIV